MYSHYLEITLKNNDKVRPDYFAGDLLQQLHHFNQRPSQKLAISFPEIDEESNRIGKVFRIFGIPETLKRFLNQRGVKPLIGNEHCYWTSPKSIPESIVGHVSYIRDRSHEKVTPSAIRRAEERAIRRAMAGKNKRLTCAEDAKALREKVVAHRETIEKKPRTSIPMTSASTGQPFLIQIRSAPSSQKREGAFNSYGLSDKEGITLPDF